MIAVQSQILIVTYNYYNQLFKLFFIGGMLGLFCGASFISIFEIIYWLLKAFLSFLIRDKDETKLFSTRQQIELKK